MSQSPPAQDPIPNRLKDLVALITGAGGNIGLESARRYLLEGAKVVLVDINSQALAQSKEALVKAVQDSPNQDNSDTEDLILTIQADVTSEEGVQRYVDESVRKFGRLDIALLCTGISYASTSILDSDIEQFDKVMNVNCRSGMSRC